MTKSSSRKAVVLLSCIFALAWSGLSLSAEREAPDVCCSVHTDCEIGSCCPADAMGLPDCSGGDHGYCRTTCIRMTLS